MTDEEMNRAFESIPESPGFITLQCVRCGESSNHMLDVSETMDQANILFAASHAPTCKGKP